MATLNLKLEGQLLSKENEIIISSGDSNVDNCVFHFDAAWSDYANTAVFYQAKNKVSYAVLDNHNSCSIPADALVKEGYLYIGIFGVNGKQILTSTVVKIDVLEGAISGTDPIEDPSDSVYMSIISKYKMIMDQMAGYNTTAGQLSASYRALELAVNKSIADQNAKLDELGQFDAGAIMTNVSQLQSAQTALSGRIDTIDKVFVLPSVQINFTNNVCQINDSRVKTTSFVDVYFTADSYGEAAVSEIKVDSAEGAIVLSCKDTPLKTLTAGIVVRRL